MSNAPHDSELLFNFAPGGALAPSDSKGTPVDLPTFDLMSKSPLPDTPVDGLPAERFRTNGLPPEPQPPAAMGPPPVDDEEREAGEIWLSGSVILCGCPDCRAPMTVRTWLMVADCWRCGASIELSEEQEKRVRRLLKQQDSKQTSAATPTAAVAAPTKTPAQPKREPAPQPKAKSKSRERKKTPATPPPPVPTPPPTNDNGANTEVSAPDQMSNRSRRRRRARSAAATQARRRAPLASPATLARQAVGDFFKHTPAWVVSLVIHCLLLTLLALWTLQDDDGEQIVISSTVNTVREEGTELEAKFDTANFDLPIPNELDVTDPEIRDTVIKADQDAMELRVDPASEASLPEIQAVRNRIESQSGSFASVAARDPRVRVEMIQREGGTTLTEAAVSRGLRWLSLHQSENGGWSLNRFNRVSGCNCRNSASQSNDVAATALVLLPYLGAGQTHLTGRYKTNVARGLRFLLDNQSEDGKLASASAGNSLMYGHGQAAIVLCEAFFMTGDEKLREPAQRAINYIVKAQHKGGGWRYRPGQEGDTSVVGWQIMALHSAKVAGLEVPPATLQLASHFLDSVQSNDGATYAYIPSQRRSPKPTMTAEGLLCRMYLGWKLDNPGMQQGVKILAEKYPPTYRGAEMYYWYYGTQTMHHAGGKAWEDWNFDMRKILVEGQSKKGHEAGSWSPKSGHDHAGGRIYTTSLAVCTLEVYYRHLPIFRQIDLAGDFGE